MDSTSTPASAVPVSTASITSTTGSSKLLAPTASFSMKKATVSDNKSSQSSKSEKIHKGPTIPNSPKFHRSNHATTVLSKEEREANELAAIKAAEQKRLEANKRAYEKLKATATVAAKSVSSTRSTKQLTIPETPMHNLTKRMGVKEKPPPLSQEEENFSAHVKKSLDFDMTSGSGSGGDQPHGPQGPTMPKPFRFATEKRFGSKASSAAAEGGTDAAAAATVGELIAQFHKDPRSHYVPVKAASGLTVARAPVFETDKRLQAGAAGRERALTREEREAALMEEFQRHSFKAKPVNAVLHSGGSGGQQQQVYIPPKPLTEFKPFQLATERRGEARAASGAATADPAPTDVFVFKARPMPTFSAEEIPGSPHANIPLTVAHSPAFHGTRGGGNRASSAPARRQLPHHSEAEAQRRSALAAVKEEASQPPRTHGEGGVTRPKPFHLYTGDRGNMYKQMLQQKIQAEQEAEKRMHDLAPAAATANAIPAAVKDSSKVFAPKTSSKPLTVVNEFQMESLQKHELAQHKLQAKLQEEEKNRRESSTFHARPVPTAILAEPDFVSYLPSEGAAVGDGRGMGAPPRKCLVPQEVHLQTKDRVAQRAAFDAGMNEKMAALALEKQQAQKKKEEAEAAEIKALRRKSVAEGGFCFKSSSTHYQPATPAAVSVVPKSIFTAFVPGAANVPLTMTSSTGSGKENAQQFQKQQQRPATLDARHSGKTTGGGSSSSGTGPVRIRPFGESSKKTSSTSAVGSVDASSISARGDMIAESTAVAAVATAVE